MSRAGLAGLMALGLAGCASLTPLGPVAPTVAPPPPPPPPVEVGSIVGQGAFRTVTGALASCAGQSVALTADTPRSRARMMALYGSVLHASEPISLIQARSAKLGPSSDLIDSTQCEADGHFHFTNLSAGGYFLIARVKLSRPENGHDQLVVMQAVGLRTGETRQVRLAP